MTIPGIQFQVQSASSVILVEGSSDHVTFKNIDSALRQHDTQISLFGKPEVQGQRRMGVALARGTDIDDAKSKAISASDAISVDL